MYEATRIMECTDSSSLEEKRGVVDSSTIEDGEALFEAARLGRVSDVRYLIKEKGCDRLCRDENGRTVLHEAAFNGQLQVVQCLIDELGVDPKSCRDDKGQTPLHAAAKGGEQSVLRYLIKEKGCDPMSRDENGWSVLHAAATQGTGDLKVIQYLIEESGVDPKSCIHPMLSTIILGQNLRTREESLPFPLTLFLPHQSLPSSSSLYISVSVSVSVSLSHSLSLTHSLSHTHTYSRIRYILQEKLFSKPVRALQKRSRLHQPPCLPSGRRDISSSHFPLILALLKQLSHTGLYVACNHNNS